MDELGETLIGDYIVRRTLGEGTTSKVKLAQHRETGQYYAIKIIKKSDFSQKPNFQRKIEREIALMRMLDHPNILKLHTVLESSRYLHIVIEYAHNGELFDYLVSSKTIQENLAISFFRQIIYGLDYLHQHSICHRDLKPENILLDQNNQIKIADFGFARWMKNKTAETSCGSPHYASPEVIRGQTYDGAKADIWSAGVILYALLAGFLPFDDPSVRSLLIKVKKGKFMMPERFHPDIQDLLRGMIEVDVNKRFTLEQIKSHRAFRFGIPDDYQLPKPIPFPDLGDPINSSALSKQISETLNAIGISPEEITEDLSQKGTNSTKIFVTMMKEKTLITQLPWQEATTEMSQYTGERMEGFGDGTILDAGAYPNQPENLNMAVPESGFSFAAPTPWFTDDPDLEFENSIQYGPSSYFSESVMAGFQHALIQFKFAFFHPDPFTLLAQHDSKMFIRLRVIFPDAGSSLVILDLNHSDRSIEESLSAKIEEIYDQRQL